MNNAPRLEIDLDKIAHNAQQLCQRLNKRGIGVTGVTKACLGSPALAQVLIAAGVKRIGDSHLQNIHCLRQAKVTSEISMIRSPMLSQVAQVIEHASVSFNTELTVLRALSRAALSVGRIHGIILMVELGDLREGIMPEHVLEHVRETIRLPNLQFKGIGTNLACRSGIAPEATNMHILSELADKIEKQLNHKVGIISGGNSANLEWALGTAEIGRINDLRLGEAILLGRETLHRRPIDDLHNDAITLHVEVIESKQKPSLAYGSIAQNAFGDAVTASRQDRGSVAQAILAIGRQDSDPSDLRTNHNIHIMGSSSDHLIVESEERKLAIGDEVTFQIGYSALIRSMCSPFVKKIWNN